MDDTCLANYTTIDFLKVWEIFLEGDIREPALHYFHARNICIVKENHLCESYKLEKNEETKWIV